jgi:hypothetical protein
MTTPMSQLSRVCVKLYAPEPSAVIDDAAVYVPIFHEWIRRADLGLVAIDVADYAHVPDGPGIMLVAHEAAFSLDRTDGRFGLLGQRRTPVGGGAAEAIATTLRQVLEVAERLQREPPLEGTLNFDLSTLRIESNDRLNGPNTEEGYSSFEPAIRQALSAVFPGSTVTLNRIANDPRDRLAVEARMEGASARGGRAA